MVVRRRSASSSICATRARGLTMDVRSRARSPSRCAKAKSRRPCTATPSLSTVGPHQLSFDVVPAGWAADAGASVALRVFVGDFLVNGTTIYSNTIERQYLDHAPVNYEYFTGQALNVLAVEVKQGAIATYTKTYIGKSATITPARAAGATDIPAPAFGVLNTTSNVGRIGFNGSTISGPNFVLAASFNINNNYRAQKSV